MFVSKLQTNANAGAGEHSKLFYPQSDPEIEFRNTLGARESNGVSWSSAGTKPSMWWEMDSENQKISQHEITQSDIYKDLSTPKRFDSPCKLDNCLVK